MNDQPEKICFPVFEEKKGVRPFSPGSLDHPLVCGQSSLSQVDGRPSRLEDMEEPLTEKAVLKRAEREAARIIERARKRASEIEGEAYERGFAQGEKDGAEMGGKKFDKILSRFEELVFTLDTHHERYAREHEKAILELIGKMAEKVILSQVALDTENVRRVVADTVARAADWVRVTVHVNPKDLETVEILRPDFLQRFSGLKSLNFKKDETVSRGGCVVTGAFGELDARLENRLENVRMALIQAHAEKGGQEGEER